ncbi:uncharacterized protein MEPE_05848 [Melanopsichium pennsylvanicum]|uniref:DUF1772-domain-containing protein n=2 Tax=Melanopsichium pennsylvanicum TaxID=63383 RepID=A0AAJ4XRU3_9BASI|nr:conserved hypothetical protein [Melanopsichium pennsylvanicum 4]SNX87138.1 uncharacterized protein MEPE_05848 [Melanopsichium pennsylvanicum]
MFAPITALVGLTCSGLVAGITASYPLIINTHFIDPQGTKISPAALHVNLSIPQRLTLWERAFKGGFVVPLLAIVSAATLTTFALRHNPSSSPSAKRLDGDWETRKKLILGSAALTGSLVLFTLLAIKPTNTKLMALRVAANNKEPVSEALVEKLLKRWTQLHNVRVGAAIVGFAVGLFSFIVV